MHAAGDPRHARGRGPGSGRVGSVREASLRFARRARPDRGRREELGALLRRRRAVAVRVGGQAPEAVDRGGRPRPALLAMCQTTWYRDAVYYSAPWRGRWDTELG